MNKLWQDVKPKNAVTEFAGSSLYRFDPFKLKSHTISSETSTSQQSTRVDLESSSPPTPRKMLQQAIIHAITPPASKTEQTLNNSKPKQVQDKTGEVLTGDNVAKRLYKEQQRAKLKK